jgi:preprotein translocase subunit YajC
VTKVEDNELQVEIAEGVKIKIVRGTVSEVRNKSDKSDKSDKSEAAPASKAKASS